MSTTLRWVRILGPEGKVGPLWQLTANVLFSNDRNGRQVDRAPALRGLNLSGISESVRDKKTGKTYDFVAPELLQARIEVMGKEPTRIEAPKLHDFQKGNDRPKAEGDHDVLLSPVGEKWPDIESTRDSKPGKPGKPKKKIKTSQITVPACRLSAGAVPIRFKIRTTVGSKPVGFANFLGCDSCTNPMTVLGGCKLVDQSAEQPLIWLVPEGIELEVWIPNPFVDMLKDAEEVEKIPVRVRIEPVGDGFQARLVRVLEHASLNNFSLTAQFRDILRALRGMNAPLLAETDTRRIVPPFSWQLFVDASGLHVKQPDHDWRIRIDPDLLTVRLSTDEGRGSKRNAIARLEAPKTESTNTPQLTSMLELVRSTEGDTSSTTLRYAVTEVGKSPEQLTVSYQVKDRKFGGSKLASVGEILAYTPLENAAKRRIQPEGSEPYAFLPVRQGTLQIPACPVPETAQDSSGSADPSAFQGNCVFRRKAYVLELDNATDAEVSTTWTNQQATEVTLRFGGLSGSLREALWTAEESPTPERLLPTGRHDPAALRELIPSFRPGRPHNSRLTFTSGVQGQTGIEDVQGWQLVLECPKEAVLWTRCTGLPLITAAPMLTLGTASAPSELRSLMPVGVKGELTLSACDQERLVTAEVEPVKHDVLTWPHPVTGSEAIWGPPSVQMVSPTAPGLDYAFAPAELPEMGNAQVSLRYDLPILDELFALPTGEKPETKENRTPAGEESEAKENVTPTEINAGVLNLGAINRFWAERKFQLAATRTQDARATGWEKLGVSVDGPVGLAQPYAADATIVFSKKYQLGDETCPLGGYCLTWAGGATEDLSGEKALIGPLGADGHPLRMILQNQKLVPATADQKETLTLTGYAPDAYETDVGLADTRGTSMQNAVKQGNASVIRASGFLEKAGGAFAVRELFTHEEPLAVLGFGSKLDVKFWVRDLPLNGGIFDGFKNPVEGCVGPDAASFDRGVLQDAFYEWRFFEKREKNKTATYTVNYRGLRLSPLRLLSYIPGQRAQILFRAMLCEPNAERDATQQTTEPFGPEDLYSVGPLLVLEFSEDEGTLSIDQVSVASLKPVTKDEPPLRNIAQFDEGDGKLLPSNERISLPVDVELTLEIAGLAEDTEKRRKNRRLGAKLTAGLVLPKDESADVLSDPRLRFKLFGREIELDLTREESDFVFDGTIQQPPLQGVRIESACLRRTGAGQGGWALSIVLGAWLRLRESGPLVLATTGDKRDKLGWLGLHDIEPDIVEIDIARGALWIVKEKVMNRDGIVVPATPVTGINFEVVDYLDYSAAITLQLPKNEATVFNAGELVWNIAIGVVQARLSGRSRLYPCAQRSRLALRSHSICREGETTSEVFLDREYQAVLPTPNMLGEEFAFQDSGISWDPDALTVTLPANRYNAAKFDIKAADPYMHKVSTSLRGHSIPPDALAEDSNGGVTLARSVPLTLQVRHTLCRHDRHITWRSLDTVMLTTEKLWKHELDGLTTFGPRYVKSRAAYRDKTESGAFAPGVGPRKSMLSGFDDPKFVDALGENDTTLFLLGGGPGYFDAGEDSHLFGLPWVAGFDAAASLPEGFQNLMHFSDNSRAWKAAQLDARPFRPAAAAMPPKLTAPTSLIGAYEITEFLRLAPGLEDGQSILTRATTQIYFEPDPPDAEVPARDWPFFLSALIGLKEALSHNIAQDRDPNDWSVVSFHPRRDGRLLAIALLPGKVAEYVRQSEPKSDVRLLAMTRKDGVSTSSLELGASASGFDEATEALGSVRIAELAASRIAEPQLVGMVECEERGDRGDLLLRARPIRLPEDFDEFGRATMEPLLNSAHQIYASAAFGWPETVTDARPAAFAMQGTADAPVISTKAGLAARSTALSTGAAVSPKLSPGRYLATQARSVFEHGANQQTVSLPAPPSRHLLLLAPRCRTPLEGAREAAMEKALAKGGIADATRSKLPLLNASMGLIPPAYSRSFVGLRPGVLQTHIDTMVTDGASSQPLDEGAVEFGRSAVMSPVMARQVRTPRSPALPEDPMFDLGTRRRTYVSKLDRHVEGTPGADRDPWKTVLIRPNAAAMWRSGLSDRFILDLNDISILPDAVIKAQEEGKPFQLNITLWHADGETFDELKTMKSLAGAGFLQRIAPLSQRASLRAWLDLAGTRIDAVRLNWTEPKSSTTEAKVEMSLDFSNIDSDLLLEELRAPDPNVPALLHLSFRSPGIKDQHFKPDDKLGADIAPDEKSDILEWGAPVAISLPIGRKPLGRPTPDIRRRTFLFADPAFDRVLSGPGKSSQILRMSSGEAVMLALDRTEYDLSRTLYLAFGKLEKGSFHPIPKGCKSKLAFRLKPKTGPGEAPRVVDLFLAGTRLPDNLELCESLDKCVASEECETIEKCEKPERAKVYAIPLSRLQAAAMDQVPKPGDNLSIEVTLNGPDNKKIGTLSIEVPIAEKVDDPRPAAVYSIIGLSGTDACTLLHAAAPAPDRVEFVDLLDDLASGHIRKRAIFEWRETDLELAPEWPHYTMTKTDRSGGAQLPREPLDITS